MHKIPTDAFDMLVTLEKRPFERAGREVVVRLLDETLPDGTKLVAASDPSYPPELAALEEHPAVLVHEGDLSLTERQLRVSIVGSRDASDSARADARRVARELAARGAVVVSGLAAGIDTAAHEGALEARSPSGTVGLLENPPLDSHGRPLVQTVSSAADVEEALSPWSTVWWL